MKRTIVIWLSAALALGGAMPGDAAAKRRGCTKKGAKVVASDHRVRILRVYPRYDFPRYWLCFRRSGRMRRLRYDGEWLTGFVVRYPFVAYLEGDSGSGATFHDLYRYNVRRDRSFLAAGVGTWGGFESVTLHRSGALAWIREAYGADSTGRGWVKRSVETLRAWEEPRVLDPGPSVERGSLAMTRSGRRVYWMNAGEPRTARLR